MERVQGAFAVLRVEARRQHVLAQGHVPGRGKREVIGHADVVTLGEFFSFGGRPVPAHITCYLEKIRRRHKGARLGLANGCEDYNARITREDDAVKPTVHAQRDVAAANP